MSLKFSDRELADLRQVVYGGYKQIKPRQWLGRPGGQGKMEPGGIDYNFYKGLRPEHKFYIAGHDPMKKAKKGSASRNFGKIAKNLGIKNVDSTRDLQQIYDYVLGYKNEPQQSQAAPTAPAPAPEPGSSTPPTLPVSDFPEPQGPTMEDIASKFQEQIAAMQQGFMQSMQQQTQMFQQMQASQSERMEALQQQMMQAQVAQQQRPEVAGVKMAEGAGGTPMQIARRGVSGAFGRRGMRISSLNV